jgi:multidrug efflux system membrane fusion protein
MSKKHWIASLIMLTMSVWLVGQQYLAATKVHQAKIHTTATPQVERIERVRGVVSSAELHLTNMTISGRTAPNRLVKVKAEISGRIVQLAVEKGDSVETGDLLCKLATESRISLVSKAIALRKQALLEYRGILDLAERGLHSEIAIAQSQSRLDSAQHDVHSAKLQLSRIEIRSPFAGVVEHHPVEVGDFVPVGGVCAEIIDLDPLLLVGQIAEKDIGFIEPGQKITAQLLTGENIVGKIRFVSRAADDATRSYKVEAEVPNHAGNLRAGITAEINFITGTKLAHQIEPAALVLNDEGHIGVRTVDENNLVEFFPVNIISEGTDGFWVTGLEQTINLITVGQEIVGTGQLVEIVLNPLSDLATN